MAPSTARLAADGAWVSLDGVSERSLDAHVGAVLRPRRAPGHLGRVLVSQDAGWYHVGEPGGGRFPSLHVPLRHVPARAAEGRSERGRDEDAHRGQPVRACSCRRRLDSDPALRLTSESASNNRNVEDPMVQRSLARIVLLVLSVCAGLAGTAAAQAVRGTLLRHRPRRAGRARARRDRDRHRDPDQRLALRGHEPERQLRLREPEGRPLPRGDRAQRVQEVLPRRRRGQGQLDRARGRQPRGRRHGGDGRGRAGDGAAADRPRRHRPDHRGHARSPSCRWARAATSRGCGPRCPAP